MIEVDYAGEDIFLLTASNDFGDLVHTRVSVSDIESLLETMKEYEGSKTFQEIHNERRYDTYTILGKGDAKE